MASDHRPIRWLGDATQDADVWELSRRPRFTMLGGPTTLYFAMDDGTRIVVPSGWWIYDWHTEHPRVSSAAPPEARTASAAREPWTDCNDRKCGGCASCRGLTRDGAYAAPPPPPGDPVNDPVVCALRTAIFGPPPPGEDAAPVATRSVWTCDRCEFRTGDEFAASAHRTWHTGEDAARESAGACEMCGSTRYPHYDRMPSGGWVRVDRAAPASPPARAPAEVMGEIEGLVKRYGLAAAASNEAAQRAPGGLVPPALRANEAATLDTLLSAVRRALGLDDGRTA